MRTRQRFLQLNCWIFLVDGLCLDISAALLQLYYCYANYYVASIGSTSAVFRIIYHANNGQCWSFGGPFPLITNEEK